jgi:phosphoglycolate phosphatase
MLIIFDLDGTLVDSARCVVAATQEAFVQHQLAPPTEEQVVASMGIPIERSFVGWSGLDDPAHLIADFREIYKSRSRELITVFPGIREALQELSDAGHQLAIATSKKREMAELNLTDCDLIHFFVKIIGSNDVGNYKPHPESAQKIIEHTGDSPETVWVVGDSTYDIDMGNAAGCKTCAVTWGAHTGITLAASSPNAMVSSVTEMMLVLTQPTDIFRSSVVHQVLNT